MSVSEKSRFVKSLCPGDRSAPQQRDLDSARIPGSGQWFLDHEKTREWLNGSHSPFLWLHGPCATGKTFLSSRVVNYIQTSDVQAGVAGVYIDKNHRQCNLADFDRALSSVARQLVSRLPDTSPTLQDLEGLRDLPYAGDDGFYDLLRCIASEFTKIYIIIDGVDHVIDRALRDLILAVMGRDTQHSTFRILFTGRGPPPDRFAREHRVPVVEARASDLDLEKYYFQAMQCDLHNHFSDESDVVRDLVRVSDGVFLPIPPTSLFTSTSEFLSSLKKAITTSSASSSASAQVFCSIIVSQIKSRPWGDVTFCVLYHLVRPSEADDFFTIAMATEAIDVWGIHHEDGRRYSEAEIIQACGGLVLTEASQTLRIRSPLLEDYLRREEFGSLYDERQALASLRYLTRDEFATGVCTSPAALKERLQKNKYLWYAARILSCALSKSSPDAYLSDFMRFSSRSGPIESYLQAAEAWPYQDETTYNELEESEPRWRCFTPGYQPLHLAAHLGVPACIIDALMGRGDQLEARTQDGKTTLHIAAEIEDDTTTMCALLSHGSDVSAVDELGDTPLAIAVARGSLAAVKILLEKGADLGALDDDVLGECAEEKPDIAAYLRERGVDVPSRDEGSDEDMD